MMKSVVNLNISTASAELPLPEPVRPCVTQESELKAMIQEQNEVETASLAYQKGGTGTCTQPMQVSISADTIIDVAEQADEEIWAAKFAATPDEKLQALAEKVRATILAGQIKPLDFENR